MNPNRYARWAEFYDLDPRNLYTDDIAFYLKHAGRKGGEVLELGCGTGRIALPLARAGFRVTGLDHSEIIQEASGNADSVTDHLRLTYYYEDQIVRLVETAGFRVKEKLGDYNGTPIDRGSELILVCEGDNSGYSPVGAGTTAAGKIAVRLL